MARTRSLKPSYYASRGAYYCWHDGKQHLLAVGPEDDQEVQKKAWTEFFKLQEDAKRPKQQAKDDTPVCSVLSLYLQHCQRNLKPKTARIRAQWVDIYIKTSGLVSLPSRNLTKQHVLDWVAEQGKPHPHPLHKHRMVSWGENTRRGAISTICAAFAYAKKVGTLDTDPLAGMPMPRTRSRSKDCLISAEEHHAIVGYLRSTPNSAASFADYLDVLWWTGARPGEIAGVTAAELKELQGVWVLDLREWKTDSKDTDRARIIVLDDEPARICRELAKRRPTGALFRSKRGTAWNEKSIVRNFERLRAKLKLSPRLCAYGYRHSFATRFLKAGKSASILATLLGNSVKTIETHYKHLLSDVAALKAQLAGLRG
jgi:integrase